MRFLRRSLMGLFLLAATVGLLALAGKTMFDAVQTRMAQEDRQRPARERVFSVNVLVAEPQDIAPVLTAFGEVMSRRTLDLRASAAGQIVELAEGFEEGASVSEGQLLARIDPRDAEARLATVRTDLTEARAGLQEAGRALSIAEDELSAARDQAYLRKTALDRARDLRTRGVGTEAAVEAAELALSSAEQAILSRRQAVANAQSSLDRANTTLARQNINLDNALRDLAATEIWAGFDGTLSGITVSPGSLVANNERIARIIDTDALDVSFRVSTPQYARLLDENGALIAAPAEIGLDARGVELRAEAQITRESAEVAEGQTGRLLFARIDRPNGLRPGDFVTVRIQEPMLRGVVKLPATALGNEGTVLVLGEGDRLEARPVTLLRRQGDDVLVRARGLAGLTLVAERTPVLGAGIRVQPIRPAGETEGDSDAPAAPETVELTEERRAKLIAFVEGNNRMPKDAKDRILTQLKEPRVPARVVERLEGRMGG